MIWEVAKGFRDLSFRMRLFKAMQEEQLNGDNLSERELLILELLSEKGDMSVSQLAAADANASDSTISSTITKLWRDKKMVTKTISPQNQRTTTIGLTDKGKKVIELINQQRAERLKILLDSLNLTDGEKEVMASVLKRAVQYLDERLGISNNGNK